MRQRHSGFASRAKGARLARFANRSGAFGLRPSGRVARQPLPLGRRSLLRWPRRRPLRQTSGRVLSSRAALVAAEPERPSASAVEACFDRAAPGCCARPPAGCFRAAALGLQAWPVRHEATEACFRCSAPDCDTRHPARCFRARQPSWLPGPDGRIDSSGGLLLLPRMRLRHRATGMVSPSQLALVATKLGGPVSPTAGACFCRHDTVLCTRPTGKAPSSTAAFVAAPREGQCHRQWRFASAVTAHAAAALPPAEPFRARSPLWRPGSDGPCRRRRRLAFVQTGTGWQLCFEGTGSVPQGPPPGKLDLVSGRSDGPRAQNRGSLLPPQRAPGPGGSCRQVQRVHAPSGLRTLRASARRDRRAGSVS